VKLDPKGITLSIIKTQAKKVQFESAFKSVRVSRETLIAVCMVDAVAIKLHVCETARGKPAVLCMLIVQRNCIESAAFQT